MPLPWKPGGLLLGLVMFGAVMLVQPDGVLHEFAVAEAVLANGVDDAAPSSARTAYGVTGCGLAAGGTPPACERSVGKPIGYGVAFVLALVAGAALSARLRGGVTRPERQMPALWRANFGGSIWRRRLIALLAGAVVVYGARLAGNSAFSDIFEGTMETSLAGYLFAVAVIAAAIPTAIALYVRD